MLAGTVYFYKNKEIVKEIDVEKYDQMPEEEFLNMVEKLKADKVILSAFYHNHQFNGNEEILYQKGTT